MAPRDQTESGRWRRDKRPKHLRRPGISTAAPFTRFHCNCLQSNDEMAIADLRLPFLGSMDRLERQGARGQFIAGGQQQPVSDFSPSRNSKSGQPYSLVGGSPRRTRSGGNVPRKADAAGDSGWSGSLLGNLLSSGHLDACGHHPRPRPHGPVR